jgi:hypothetical protein
MEIRRLPSIVHLLWHWIASRSIVAGTSNDRASDETARRPVAPTAHPLRKLVASGFAATEARFAVRRHVAR